MGLAKFVDAFWVENVDDFISTSGFEVLWKRMKSSQRMGKEIEDYVKQLSKIEQEYSKSLGRLNKNTEAEDLGTMGDAWIELKRQVDRISQTHDETSSALLQQFQKIQQFNEFQDERKKKIKESVKKYQVQKKEFHTKVTNLHKSYIMKSREKLTAQEHHDHARQSVTTPSRELEKLFSRLQRCTQSMDQADLAYRSCIDQLEEIRILWEREMTKACIEFQEQEEQRILFQREQLWKCANIGSKCCVNDDESYEQVRLRLEHCDVTRDIIEFIDNNKTGSVKPSPIRYEQFNQRGKAEEPKSTGINRGQQRPPEPLPHERGRQPRRPGPMKSANAHHDDIGIYSTISE